MRAVKEGGCGQRNIAEREKAPLSVRLIWGDCRAISSSGLVTQELFRRDVNIQCGQITGRQTLSPERLVPYPKTHSTKFVALSTHLRDRSIPGCTQRCIFHCHLVPKKEGQAHL